MKRSEMIQKMIEFNNSIPAEASDYHRFDFLLRYIQRLGMQPPKKHLNDSGFLGYYTNEWDEETEDF